MFTKIVGLLGSTTSSLEKDIKKAITMQACMDRFNLITRLCRKIIDDKNHAHYTRFILNRLNKDTALPVIELLDVCLQTEHIRNQFFGSTYVFQQFEQLIKNDPEVAKRLKVIFQRWVEEHDLDLSWVALNTELRSIVLRLETSNNNNLNVSLRRPQTNSNLGERSQPSTSTNSVINSLSGLRIDSNGSRNEVSATRAWPTLNQLEEADVAEAIRLSLTEQSTSSRPQPSAPSLDPPANVDRHQTNSLTSQQTFECPICMDSDEISDVMVAKNCGHTYHRKCIMEWLKSSNDCPNCRVRVTKDSLIKIFLTLATCKVSVTTSAPIANKGAPSTSNTAPGNSSRRVESNEIASNNRQQVRSTQQNQQPPTVNSSNSGNSSTMNNLLSLRTSQPSIVTYESTFGQRNQPSTSTNSVSRGGPSSSTNPVSNNTPMPMNNRQSSRQSQTNSDLGERAVPNIFSCGGPNNMPTPPSRSNRRNIRQTPLVTNNLTPAVNNRHLPSEPQTKSIIGETSRPSTSTNSISLTNSAINSKRSSSQLQTNPNSGERTQSGISTRSAPRRATNDTRNPSSKSNRRNARLSFKRMIWLSTTNKNLSEENIVDQIFDSFNIGRNKFAVQRLFSKKGPKPSTFISFKISVDNATTFNTLLDVDGSKWPGGFRVREFINRSQTRTETAT